MSSTIDPEQLVFNAHPDVNVKDYGKNKIIIWEVHRVKQENQPLIKVYISPIRLHGLLTPTEKSDLWITFNKMNPEHLSPADLKYFKDVQANNDTYHMVYDINKYDPTAYPGDRIVLTPAFTPASVPPSASVSGFPHGFGRGFGRGFPHVFGRGSTGRGRSSSSSDRYAGLPPVPDSARPNRWVLPTRDQKWTESLKNTRKQTTTDVPTGNSGGKGKRKSKKTKKSKKSNKTKKVNVY